MSPTDPKPNRSLQDQVREASLESVAATLASIHLAKQMRARERCSPDAGFSGGIPQDVRIPVHDLIHGLAQLQVEFVQRLLDFNKQATGSIRRALLASDVENPGPIEVHATAEECAKFVFTIVNRAGSTRVLKLCSPHPAFTFDPPSPLALAAGEPKEITTTCTGLLPGVHRGSIVVESRGIRVSVVPYVITVTSSSHQ